jgi:cytochrome c oxidase subunit 2
MFPALAGSKIATGPVKAHMDIVIHGKPGTAMQAFAQQLNDADLAAVITYERNSWGNSAGMVQPSDVKAAR